MRSRIGPASGGLEDIWWPIPANKADIIDVRRRIRTDGMRFLNGYSTRDKIMERWNGPKPSYGFGDPPQIVRAIIMWQRGHTDLAREVFAQYVQEQEMPEHERYVRKVAKKLGIWRLNA